MNQLTAQKTVNQVAQMQADNEALAEFRLLCQNFTAKLNAEPKEESIGQTPDGRAKTITISHVEMTLDEYFFGLWSTENFKWAVIANEIVGSIDVIVIHPVTGQPIRRTGAAAVQIMVDAAPSEIKDNKQLKNQWALNPSNKKSNALDMGFPKLKAECIKNAANSFGKLFGRDLNRKPGQVDTFQGLIKPPVPHDDLVSLYEMKKDGLSDEFKAQAERIIDNRETVSYNKLFKQLQAA